MTEEQVAITRVHSGGRIQIPEEIRKLFELKDGDKVIWLKDAGGRCFIEKAIQKGARYTVR